MPALWRSGVSIRGNPEGDKSSNLITLRSGQAEKEVSHVKQKLYLGRVCISGGDIFHSQDSGYDGFMWVAGIKNMKEEEI